MKRALILTGCCFLLAGISLKAQQNKTAKNATVATSNKPAEDKSKRPSPPAIARETTAGGNTIEINYSQPAVKGRTIGEQIAPYGQVWRTGANEATTIEFSKDCMINEKPVKAGKYSLYSIPGPKTWTLIINKNWKQWGTDYDPSADVQRIEIEPQSNPEFTERLTFNVNKEGRTIMMWGNVLLDFIII